MVETVPRAKGKRIVKPVVYGSYAIPFGHTRASDNHTHQWTVFFTTMGEEDPTAFIRKVQFKLHESYTTNIRVCDKPPYEVNETGWGEFEVQIRVYFMDPYEKPVTINHYLRLFNPLTRFPDGTLRVVIERYDEIIFQEPTIKMYKALVDGNGKKQAKRTFHTDFDKQQRITVERMNEATEAIQKEIEDLQESLRVANDLLLRYGNAACNTRVIKIEEPDF